MKGAVLVGAVLVTLAGASSATARLDARFEHVPEATPTEEIRPLRPPSPTDMVGEAILLGLAAYPDAQRWCPSPAWTTISEPGPAAWADSARCLIGLSPYLATEAPWAVLCETAVHEVGHLARLHFPDNPADPLHSPDPAHNMHAVSAPHPICGPVSAAEAEQALADLSNSANELAYLRGNVRALCRWRPWKQARRCANRVRLRQAARIAALNAKKQAAERTLAYRPAPATSS